MTLSNCTPPYTLGDYERWEGEWELWFGAAVALSPSAGMEHQLLSGRLLGLLSEALEEAGCGDCLVVQDVDWRVSEDTVLRPDLQLLCHHPSTRFVVQTPRMVVEILSDSTRQRDLIYKREVYGKLRVPYYLIIDPKDHTSILLQPAGEPFDEAALPATLEVDDGCCLDLDLAGLFALR